LAVCQELFGEGRGYLAPDGRASFSVLLVYTKNVTDDTENSALGCCGYRDRCWCRPVFFSDGIIGKSLGSSSGGQAGYDNVTDIHYVCNMIVDILKKERRMNRRIG
jgi:hypothetical protein